MSKFYGSTPVASDKPKFWPKKYFLGSRPNFIDQHNPPKFSTYVKILWTHSTYAKISIHAIFFTHVTNASTPQAPPTLYLTGSTFMWISEN